MTQIDTFTDILRARSSCRAFRPDPVDDAIITRIDEMGNRIDDLEKSIADLMQQAGVEEGEAAAEQKPAK